MHWLIDLSIHAGNMRNRSRQLVDRFLDFPDRAHSFPLPFMTMRDKSFFRDNGNTLIHLDRTRFNSEFC